MGAGSEPELRRLPAVHELAAELDAPHALAVVAARSAIEERRQQLKQSGEHPARDLVARAREIVNDLGRPSLRRVINATGVIVHTNLGRAPLPQAARDALAETATGYSNLELDLDTGTRGSRQVHVERLLRELTLAEGAVVVNNGAAAVLLAATALAGAGRGVVISRGQLLEIGGGFRIPEVIAQSGAVLKEVGTTNRTRLKDYKRAIDDSVGAILRVHRSNFAAVGFVEDVEIEALCELGVPVIDDVGSGVLADASGIPALAEEPSIKRSVKAGAALVCCSGDKLLGGPQAGVIVGTGDAIRAAREHPLARAVRIDKLSLAALTATLMLYRDPAEARRQIPVLAMLDASEQDLQARAERLYEAIGPECSELTRASAKVGGGALPLLELEGPAVALTGDPEATVKQLRAADPPVVARIHDGRVLLDPRTLTDEEVPLVAAAARSA
jgi:L-seryl-tRNA(Ser) seleniumtransferase